jgi:hypothetical protein
LGLFGNKKGIVSLRKTIQSLPREDQDTGIELLEGAEHVFATIGAPSQLGVGVLLAILKSTGMDEDSPVFRQGSASSLMGYACRMSQGASVPTEIAEKIEVGIIRDEAGAVDLPAMDNGPGDLMHIMEQVAACADEPSIIAYLAGCNLNAWKAFTATATFQLHRNLVKNGMTRSELIPEEAMENILRLGYMIRVVDEVAALEPLAR